MPAFSTSGPNQQFQSSATALYMQRSQLNSFYESLKMNAYLQSNRMMAGNCTALTSAANGKIELQLSPNDSTNDSVPPQL